MKRKIIDMSADLEIDGFQFLLRSNKTTYAYRNL